MECRNVMWQWNKWLTIIYEIYILSNIGWYAYCALVRRNPSFWYFVSKVRRMLSNQLQMIEIKVYLACYNGHSLALRKCNKNDSYYIQVAIAGFSLDRK